MDRLQKTHLEDHHTKYILHIVMLVLKFMRKMTVYILKLVVYLSLPAKILL